MITYLLITGGIWLALVLFEPVVAYMDAVKWRDIKYSADRAERAEAYARLNAMHQQSPVFQQMKAEKSVITVKAKKPPSPHSARARRNRRRKPLQEAYAAEQRQLAEAETPKNLQC